MSIYQFLIAVRSEGQQLMSESGETTSHLMGMFYRTLRMIDNGIKWAELFRLHLEFALTLLLDIKTSLRF